MFSLIASIILCASDGIILERPFLISASPLKFIRSMMQFMLLTVHEVTVKCSDIISEATFHIA